MEQVKKKRYRPVENVAMHACAFMSGRVIIIIVAAAILIETIIALNL